MSTLLSMGSNVTESSNVVESYDNVTDTWTRLPDLTLNKRSYMAAVVDGKIILIGGSFVSDTPNEPENTVHSLDPATGTLTELAPLKVARQFAGTAVVGEGPNALVYVCGGWGEGDSIDSVERYSPATNTWTSVANLPTTNTGCGAAVVNGVLYVVGGRHTNYLSEVLTYNATNDTWEKKTPMIYSNAYFGITSHKNYIYVVGGYRVQWQVQNYVERYDANADTWVILARITEAGQVGLTVFNDKIVVAGGNHLGGNIARSTEEYDENANKWRKLANLNVGRMGSRLIALPPTLGKINFDWKSCTPY